MTATESVEKVVLVAFGERKCPVTFRSSSDPTEEKERAIKEVFADSLKDGEEAELVVSASSGRENMYNSTVICPWTVTRSFLCQSALKAVHMR